MNLPQLAKTAFLLDSGYFQFESRLPSEYNLHMCTTVASL